MPLISSVPLSTSACALMMTSWFVVLVDVVAVALGLPLP
jgi:hypothetical protein